MGIPRPTLYRYLREYSIPHLRQSGRISIPEESFEKIRRARDLHKEGLGTESVRRAVREGGTAGTEDLKNRVDGLHDALEGLRESLKEKPAATEPVHPSPVLQTILARQSLLMSALFHLTGMVEDLLLASGKPRKPVFPDLEGSLRREPSFEQAPERPRLRPAQEAIPVQAARPTAEARSEVPAQATSRGGNVSGFAASPRPDRTGGFGSLGRRRRRGGAVILAALLAVVLLAFAVPALIGGGGPASSGGGGDGAQGGSEEEARGEGGSGAEDRAAGAEDRAAGADAEGGDQDARGADGPRGAVADSGTRVPDVSGSSVERARGALNQAGLTVGATRPVASREEPEGTVTATEPSAGSFVEAETPIALLVSGGPDAPSPGAGGSASATASASASALSSASASASASASSASASAQPRASARPR